jgi:hypothetical protein
VPDLGVQEPLTSLGRLVAEGALDDPLPGGEVEKGPLCASLDERVPTALIAGLERSYCRGDA